MLWQRVCSQSCISFRRLSVSGRWPRPHRAARTSISLRFIRSARFLTRLGKTSPSVQCVGRGFRHICFTATSASSNAYLDSAPLHLGRGFRHICFTATSASSNAYLDFAPLHLGRGFRHICFTATSASSNAYLDFAPLHLGRGFRHICKKEERSSGMQAFLRPFLFFPCVAQCLT